MNLLRCRASWLGREKHLLEKSIHFFLTPASSVGTPQNTLRVLFYSNVCLVSSVLKLDMIQVIKKKKSKNKSLSMAAVRCGGCVMAT